MEFKRWLISEAKEVIVGQDYPDTVLHGTTRISANAFIQGKRPEKTQKTLSEFGSDVIYVSELNVPHQALMFGTRGQGGKGFGGRELIYLYLRPGARMLDVRDEMSRQALWLHRVPIKFKDRPSFTDDMGEWLNEKRESRGLEPLSDAIQRVDPTHKRFSPSEYAPMLASYARDRNYDGIRFADETVILNPKIIKGAKRVPKKEFEQFRAAKRKYKPSKRGSLYTDEFLDFD